MFFPILIALMGWVLQKLLFDYIESRKKPPGPRPLPIIGNVHQLPLDRPWLAFSQWGSTYGGLMYLNIVGQPMLVINSINVAQDLLDKRSGIYSDRPVSIMGGQLVGFDEAFPMLPYSREWRNQRRMASQGFSPAKVPHHSSMQEKEAAVLAYNLLSNPNTQFSEVPRRIGASIFRATYGYSVKSKTDNMLVGAMELMKIFNKVTTPGMFLVDTLTMLRYLPRWMPGAGFIKLAETWRAQLYQTASTPYTWVRDNLESEAVYMPNMCTTVMQKPGGNAAGAGKESLLWAAVAMLGAGIDTTSSAILSFMMAMILYPDVQKKAHAELATVVGSERLPGIEDRNNLPYIRSIVAEVLRWAPPGPLGVPHALSADDVYCGYRLRKGTVVLTNIWHMLHDSEMYHSPMIFNPERFREDDTTMARVIDLAFGFGRRSCPGKHFAVNTLFAVVATVLATCDIRPGVDERGETVLPKYEYSNGVISFPQAFSLDIKPRSVKACALLEEAASSSEN